MPWLSPVSHRPWIEGVEKAIGLLSSRSPSRCRSVVVGAGAGGRKASIERHRNRRVKERKPAAVVSLSSVTKTCFGMCLALGECECFPVPAKPPKKKDIRACALVRFGRCATGYGEGQGRINFPSKETDLLVWRVSSHEFNTCVLIWCPKICAKWYFILGEAVPPC